MPPIIALDPGSEKCGLAVLGDDRRVIEQIVVSTADLLPTVLGMAERHRVETLVMGDRTGAKRARKLLEGARVPLQITTVDEHHSTLQARRRYFAEHPPHGWRRLIPITLQHPPRPYDDYVAVILGERYLASSGS